MVLVCTSLQARLTEKCKLDFLYIYYRIAQFLWSVLCLSEFFLQCCLFYLVAVEDVALLDHPFLLDPWTSTYCNRSGLLIHDDNVTEDIETLQLQILPSSATTVDPTRQFLTVYVVDNDSEFQSSIIICSCHFSLSCCVFLFSGIAHLALLVCHAQAKVFKLWAQGNKIQIAGVHATCKKFYSALSYK